jgi:2-polyprenyl-3-methyl-5-hydroxy-6-metoxy-1,4-benzoquinol methylase
MARDLFSLTLDDKLGLDIGALPIAGSRAPDDLNSYWAKRSNDRIYVMTLLYAHYFCRRKNTIADVGCHCSPLVLIVPGFKRRFAIDPSDEAHSAWADVDGATFIKGTLEAIAYQAIIGEDKFDLILCNQVIEHLAEPSNLCHLLLQRSRRLIISTTFETPAGVISGHIQDPINYDKFLSWFPRKPIMSTVSHGPIGAKIVAVF